MTAAPPRRLDPCPCGSGRRYRDCHGALASGVVSPEAAALSDRGLQLQAQMRIDEAIDSFERALALAPAFAEAHFNLALALLLRGDYARGWAEYEWRTRVRGYADYANYAFGMPRWHGEPLAGREILVHAEQGHGDTIQFSRFVQRYAGQGAQVDVFCHAPLVSLLARVPGVRRAMANLAERPRHDFHAPVIDLAAQCLPAPDAVHWTGPYLAPLPERVAEFAPVLERAPRPRIGIAWKGSPRHANDRNRSLQPDDAAALMSGAATFVNLQVEAQPLAASARHIDLGARIRDWDDTAAILHFLDAIVTVDTALAHLAGAMGKPVTTLLPFSPDWRWGVSGERTRWYPTMRLLRQEVAGNWGSVIRRAIATFPVH